MNRIFAIGDGFTVPDGTTVFPFLNPLDPASGLPPGLFDGFSVAAGEIAPGTASAIHVLPRVTQVTFVLSGSLTVRMRDPEAGEPYALRLGPEQAALTRPGTRLQLVNEGDAPCRVLYIVSPAYRYEVTPDGTVAYDDARLVAEWEEL